MRKFGLLKMGLIVSLVANLLLIGAAGYMVNHRIGQLCDRVSALAAAAKKPKVGGARIKFAQQSSLFKELPDTEREIVFLGDSHISFGRWSEICLDPGVSSRIRNRGIGGDNSSQIVDRLDEIVAMNPESVFLMIGTNDLGQQRPVDQIANNYRYMLNRISEGNPDVRFYLHSVLPVNMLLNGTRIKTEDINLLNQSLRTVASEYQASFIDLHSLLVDSEQQLDPAFTIDGVHLNGAGYRVWHGLLEDYLPVKCRSNN